MSAKTLTLLRLLFLYHVVRIQCSYLNCSVDTRYPLRFVGFFPCLNQWGEVGDCDILTLTAVKRAIAEINQDTSILKCFEIKMLPITVEDPIEVKLCHYNQYIDLAKL